MKIIKVLLAIFGGVVAIFLIIGVFLSNHAELERSIIIEVAPSKVYNEVNQFDHLEMWSPWVQMDPEAIYEFPGPPSGVGAKYTWISENPNIGTGSQEIVESRVNEYVKTKMEFADMQGEFTAEFILEPVEQGTKVRWTYQGTAEGFFMRYFMASTDMFLGPMYEEGLLNLKNYLEGLPDPDPEIIEGDSTITEAG